jgi:serine protease
VRVIGKCGGFDSDILAAMLWAAGVHVDGVPDNPYPAQVENLSLGALGRCPRSYQEVIDEVAARGVLVVVSAGNEGGPVDSPANCERVAAIAGLRHTGTKVGYSSLGPEVAISAPAGNCVNPSGACLFSIDTTSNSGATARGADGYTDQLAFNVGTSFSAPIVAAIAGLMMSANGNLRPPQVVDRLREGAVTPFPASSDDTVPMCRVPAGLGDVQGAECNCTTATCGAGMANAPGALRAARRPIAAIAAPSAVSAGQDVVLSAAGSAAACGRALSTYSWSIVGEPGFGIAGSDPAVAVVVAPATGSFTVRVTVTDDAGDADTADVIVSADSTATDAPAHAGTTACRAVLAPPVEPITVSVSPATASVAAGAMQTFSAAVANAADSAVGWQVDGVTGGNESVGVISAAGVYAAPASVASKLTVTVTAISMADLGASGSAEVTVTPPPASQSAPSGGGGGRAGVVDLLLLLAALAILRRKAPALVVRRSA